jgi:UDP-sugar transporter A1/2/3
MNTTQRTPHSSTLIIDQQTEHTEEVPLSPIFLLDSKMLSKRVQPPTNINLIKLGVLLVLCLQNSLFTVLRRYSQGVLKETYSKHEVLLFGEMVKMVFSAYVIYNTHTNSGSLTGRSFTEHIKFLTLSSQKMLMLSLIYGFMNILSYVALRNVSAGIFTICAQLKILTTASFSTVMLKRSYSWTKWRALFTLIIGVLLFSEPIWNESSTWETEEGNFLLGSCAVLTEVILSGFASIYFEKVIKADEGQNKLSIWERNLQLALGSFPVYIMFLVSDGGGEAGYFGGWTKVTFALAMLGAGGGLLVALSIKYGDAILKTLATTGAIIVSSLLDHFLLGGPLTTSMVLAGCVVVTSIFNYSFDTTPPPIPTLRKTGSSVGSTSSDAELQSLIDDEEKADK